MRRLITLILSIICCHTASAQNLILGVPAYDTITKCTTSSRIQGGWLVLCSSAFVEIDTALVNRVHGIDYYLLITNSTLPKDSLRRLDYRNTDLGPVNAGDSILLSHNDTIRRGSTSTVFFGSRSVNGQFTYAIMASGIPTSLTDTFMCKEDYRITGSPTSHGCAPIGFYYNCYLATCVVQEPFVVLNTANPDRHQQFMIYPTVARDQLYYNSELPDRRLLKLIDGFGRTVRSQEVTPGKHAGTIDVSTLPGGVYYYSLCEGENAGFRGRIVVLR